MPDIYKEYRIQRKRLQDKVYYYNKKGYVVSKSIVPEFISNPTQADIDYIKDLSQEIREYVDVYNESGDFIGSLSAFDAEIKARKHSSEALYDFTREAVDQWFEQLRNFPTVAYSVLAPKAEAKIAEVGYPAFADALQKAESSGLVITYEIAYDETLLNDYFDDVCDLIDLDYDERQSVSELMGDNYYEP